MSTADKLAEISRAVTSSYGLDMDEELVMRRRVGKVFVEAGELGDAIEGYTGENPRKGFYKTADDVVKELLDCASASRCCSCSADRRGAAMSREMKLNVMLAAAFIAFAALWIWVLLGRRQSVRALRGSAVNVSPLPLTISESSFQDTVITLARYKQWMCAHFRPAQMQSGRWATAMQGDVGFPDLVLSRHGQVLFVELKPNAGAPHADAEEVAATPRRAVQALATDSFQ